MAPSKSKSRIFPGPYPSPLWVFATFYNLKTRTIRASYPVVMISTLEWAKQDLWGLGAEP